MLEEKNRSFEDVFNEWYKKFLEEEKLFNEEIKYAKMYRDEKLVQARREALDTIKSYEMEQKDKLDSEKEKLNVHKNNSEQLDVQYNNEVAAIQLGYKQNKDKVIEYLLDSIFTATIELPDNIRKGGAQRD